MAKSREGVLGLDHAQHHAEQQRREGDDIISELAPEQEAENRSEEREEDDLINCHGSVLTLRRPRQQKDIARIAGYVIHVCIVHA